MKKERSFIGSVFKWMFILFNLFMLAMVYMTQTSTDDSNFLVSLGGGMGIAMMVGMWIMGAIVLGAFMYFTRVKDNE
jgi:vacuolar-type H+-ATPase subunit I/STV1